jgi:hypothetical protein
VTRGFGIVGTGVIAAIHADAIAMLPDARLVAVTDANADRAAVFAAARDCVAEPDLSREDSGRTRSPKFLPIRGTAPIRRIGWELSSELLTWPCRLIPVSPVTESNRRPSPYHACRFHLIPSRGIGLPQIRALPTSVYIALHRSGLRT